MGLEISLEIDVLMGLEQMNTLLFAACFSSGTTLLTFNLKCLRCRPTHRASMRVFPEGAQKLGWESSREFHTVCPMRTILYLLRLSQEDVFKYHT